jgi:hypothetical protein
MAYDGGSPHANYDWSIASANSWKSRGLPANKTVLGVPFYSRPGYFTYSQLVGMDPANANRDCATVNGAQQCYNGIPTIKRKTQWAMVNAGGIMNWELSQDTTGSTSLVSAIYDTVVGGNPPGGRTGQITGIGQVRRRGRGQLRQRHGRSVADVQRDQRAAVDRRHGRHASRAWQVHGHRQRRHGQRDRRATVGLFRRFQPAVEVAVGSVGHDYRS